MLLRRNVSNVLFVGDSYIRHAYEGLLLLLTGDVATGALEPGTVGKIPDCAGDGQFEEAKCRDFVRHQATSLCGGRVNVALKYGHAPVPPLADPGTDLIVWGVGNHPVHANYATRYGVNNASVYTNELFQPACKGRPAFDAEGDRRPKVLWMPPHCRPAARFDDEDERAVRRYVVESTHALHVVCGVPTVDVYGFTSDLVRYYPDDAKMMSWDGSHWSRAINVLKAVHVLHALQS